MQATQRHLRTDDFWSSTFADATIDTPASWSYLGQTSGNKLKVEDLEKLIAAKEQAVPLIQKALDRATDESLRAGTGRESLKMIEKALADLRADIQKDTDTKLSLLADPDGGGMYLRYEVKSMDGTSHRWNFRVAKGKKGWGIEEVMADDAPFRQPPAPRDIASATGITIP